MAEFAKLASSIISDRRGGIGDSRALDAADQYAGFHVMVTGQVEAGEFHGMDNLYFKYSFNYGADWRIIQGVDTGLSQIARKSSGGDTTVVWNFPIDITFKSTNAYGWPRLVFSVYGVDGIGRDVVRGYGSVLIPTSPGRFTRYVRLFNPRSSSLLQQFLSWLTGSQPEFFDSKFVSQGEGREVTRVSSNGVVKLQLSVVTRGMQENGFNVQANSTTVGGGRAGTGGGGLNGTFAASGTSFYNSGVVGGGGGGAWRGGESGGV